MANGAYEYQSDFARRYVAQGRAEGEAQGQARGEARGRAHALLGVLSARGIAVPDDVRARISECADLDLLDRWLASAVTAVAITDVVGT